MNEQLVFKVWQELLRQHDGDSHLVRARGQVGDRQLRCQLRRLEIAISLHEPGAGGDLVTGWAAQRTAALINIQQLQSFLHFCKTPRHVVVVVIIQS